MPDLALVAGFDAGQTHTTCRLAAAGSGAVLAEGQGPGVCHLQGPNGPDRFGSALGQSLQQALDQLSPGRLIAAGIGASGIEVGTPVQDQARQLAAAALGLPLQGVLVTGDERTALRGAMGSQSAGIVVISGTGMIAVGRNGAGEEHRCGGWGWLLDGAGSAMDIGRDGLALTLEMADGRRSDSPLRARIWAGLGLDPGDPQAPQAIKARVVAPDFGAAGFARSAQALARMVATISQRLALGNPPVWPLGGALEHLELLRQRFAAALALHCPGARLEQAAGDGCSGALALARLCLEP